MSDDAKIIFVTCDDHADVLERHLSVIDRTLQGTQLPYTIVQFDDGKGAEEYIKTKGDSKGVILISDGSMKDVGGFMLLRNLERSKLLPTNCALCSSISTQAYQECMELVRLPPTAATYMHKDFLEFSLPEFIQKALPKAGAEVGLSYTVPAKPKESAVKAQRKRKPSGAE